MSLSLLLEFVGAQQRGDHVRGDHERAGRVDQSDHHGSDPLQQEGVGDKSAEDGKAAGDVDQVGHVTLGFLDPGTVAPPAIKSRRERLSVGIRKA
jgi:hypothetical protein